MGHFLHLVDYLSDPVYYDPQPYYNVDCSGGNDVLELDQNPVESDLLKAGPLPGGGACVHDVYVDCGGVNGCCVASVLLQLSFRLLSEICFCIYLQQLVSGKYKFIQ